MWNGVLQSKRKEERNNEGKNERKEERKKEKNRKNVPQIDVWYEFCCRKNLTFFYPFVMVHCWKGVWNFITCNATPGMCVKDQLLISGPQ